MPLVWTHLLPSTFEGRARMNVQNALAATGAAWAAGAHLHDIRQGLRTFTTSYFMAPGRLNMFELDGYRVIVDYAHNPPAVRSLGEFVDQLAEPSTTGRRPLVTGRRIGVMATAGDRRDEDIVELGRTAAALLRHADRARGREQPRPAARRDGRADRAGRARRDGQRRPLPRRSRPCSTSWRRPGARWTWGSDGDVIVVCVDHANDVWKELQRRQHGASERRHLGSHRLSATRAGSRSRPSRPTSSSRSRLERRPADSRPTPASRRSRRARRGS